jgi:predicted DNA-binding ribbon-helix-helix protein
MRRVNLNDTKLTIRVSTDAKRKAAEIAKRRGLSISQLVDELIRKAEETKLDAGTLRTIVSEELEKWGRSAAPPKGAGRSAK